MSTKGHKWAVQLGRHGNRLPNGWLLPYGPAACLLDRAAQTASFAGEEQIISVYTRPAEQLAAANQDYEIILCNYS